MARCLRYLGFAFANADLLLETDIDLQILFATGASKSLLGASPDSFLGRSLRDLLAPSCQSRIAEALKNLKENARLGPMRVAARRQQRGPIALSLSAYRLEGGNNLFATLSPIPARESADSPEAPLDRQTGLLASAAFPDTLTAALQASDAQPDACITLVQIDNLSEIEASMDRMGFHDLMSELGAVLKAHSNTGVAGRLGNSKFGVMHEGGTEAGEEIGRDLADIGNGVLRTTRATMSVTDLPVRSEDERRAFLHVLRHVADFDGQIGERQSCTSLLDTYNDTGLRIQGLRSSISERKLSLHYQPIVRLGTERVHHYEALLRPKDGAPAAETVAFAEELGLIGQLDLLVCEMALEALRKLPPSARIAVNLSGASLSQDSVVDQLLSMLPGTETEGARLLFEITESSVIEDLDRAARIVGRLQSAGHSICLDDFGTGAAQLPYLRALDVDYVKLDGSYVSRLGQNARDDALAAGLLRMLNGLGVKTIAERVETREQALLLQHMGCRFAQGWLFGRPTPLEDLVRPPTALKLRNGRPVGHSLSAG